MIEKINRISDEIISSISYEGMTDYEKVLAVNKYIIENIEYDDTLESGCWDAFLTKKAGNIGFAYATGLLLEKMGVKSIYVTGYAGIDGHDDIDKYELINYVNNAHSWNIVFLDGQCYHLDVTYNKIHSNNGLRLNKYFLVSDEQMSYDHAWRRGM